MYSRTKLVFLCCAFLVLLVALASGGFYLAHREQHIHVTHILQHGKIFDAQFTYSPSSLFRKPDKLTAISVSIGSHIETMPVTAFADLPPLIFSHAPTIAERKGSPELTVWTQPGASNISRVTWRFQNDSLSERRLFTPRDVQESYYAMAALPLKSLLLAQHGGTLSKFNPGLITSGEIPVEDQKQ
jgi:hypothetical protein